MDITDKSYQEYDAEIKSCDDLIEMLEATISEIQAKKQAKSKLRKAAYEKIHPRCKAKREFEHHTTHAWYTTEKCLLEEGHKGSRRPHYEKWSY